MHEKSSVQAGIDTLIQQARHVVPGVRSQEEVSGSDTASEFSGDGYDVDAWGNDIFSYEERREELERLRDQDSASSTAAAGRDGTLCVLPAIVPGQPHGLWVTPEMQSVLDAVLSETSLPQIGFCGMGGVGKTTVSSWVARNEGVRKQFKVIAWVTLGQMPVVDSCLNLLHTQLTGSALPEGVSPDQKNELLKQAFLAKSVLLVLDDWYAKLLCNIYVHGKVAPCYSGCVHACALLFADMLQYVTFSFFSLLKKIISFYPKLGP